MVQREAPTAGLTTTCDMDPNTSTVFSVPRLTHKYFPGCSIYSACAREELISRKPPVTGALLQVISLFSSVSPLPCQHETTRFLLLTAANVHRGCEDKPGRNRFSDKTVGLKDNFHCNYFSYLANIHFFRKLHTSNDEVALVKQCMRSP